LSGDAARPLLRLKPRADRRLKSGHPWAFSNEIAPSPALSAVPAGGLVRLEADDGTRFGTFYFNPHSLIAARLLDRDPDAVIDGAWFAARLGAARALRARLGLGPAHRLIHAEADGLPGLVIDRFDDVAVVQANTAGMERLLPELLAGLAATLPLRAVVARNDSPVRTLEALPRETRLLIGEDMPASVTEGGVRFPLDLLGGQKTGWYFDQRPHRDMIARLAPGARVLDLFCHTGGFGLRAAHAGAAEVLLIDQSAPALALAAQAAAENGFSPRITTRQGEVFAALAALGEAGQRYDIVIADPPAFAPTRKDQAAGLRAYARLARLACGLVAPGGFLFIASCSHHAPAAEFTSAVANGLHRARREGRILASGGAGPDHPVHPALPESAYLKTALLQIS
jgi:23S rRNA (cytosine1962-C5)-methyltransferase